MKSKDLYFFNKYYEIASTPSKASIKKLFYELINYKLAEENLLFSGIYAKLHYLLDSNVNSGLINIAHYLLKSFITNDNDIDLMLKSLEVLLQVFISNRLDKKSLEFLSNKVNFKNNEEYILDEQAVVLEVSGFQKNKKNQIFSDIFLSCNELGYIKLRLWDHSNGYKSNSCRKFYLLINILEKHQTIYLQNIKKISDNYFSTTAETRIILEPNYLVNVTSVAECFYFDYENKVVKGNPNLFFLSLLEGNSSNLAIFKGKMLNDYFDELIQNENVNDEDFFQNYIKNNILETLQFSKDEIYNLYEEVIKTVGKTIKSYTKKKNKKSLSIEPTFYSQKYGLLGRLDLLEKQNEKIDVIELKSSTPPGKDVWINNKAQVVGYNLLIESTFDNKKGNSAIFYCKDENNPIRNVYSSSVLEQQFLMVRNYIVATLFKIVKDEKKITEITNIENFGYYPIYKKQFINELNALYKSVEIEYLEYFNIFTKFLIKELIVAKIGNNDGKHSGFSRLWNDFVEDKKESDSCYTDLKIISKDENGRIKLLNKNKKLVNIRVGDIVLLYKQDIEPLKQQVFKGILDFKKKDEIIITLWNKNNFNDFLDENIDWIVEPDFMEVSISQWVSSLVTFLKSSNKFKNMIFGKVIPEFNKFPANEINYVTKYQNQIIQKSLEAKDYILIQGPPGTGKTSAVLKNIVKQIYFEDKENIVILAYTNRAVEEISIKLRKEDINFVRLGRVNVAESLYNLANKLTFEEIIDTLKKTKIIVSTVSTFQVQQNYIKNIIDFDVLIVDEASQLIEPHLIGILPNFKRFILIGDHKQLPAVVIQNDTNINNKYLKKYGYCDFKEPIFERLWYLNDNFKIKANVMLKEHFRMHDKIAGLLSDIYSDELISVTERQKNNLLTIKTEFKERIIFIESELETKNIFLNDSEAKIVVFCVKELLKNYKNHEIGIITPWRSQIALIQSELEKNSIYDVCVDTVERFQGSERNVIIYSFSVNCINQINLIQVLDKNKIVDRKLNVVVSRAKEQLIIIGNKNILIQNRIYKKLIDKIKETGLWISTEDIKNKI